MRTKYMTAPTKAASGDEGRFVAYAAVFNNIDSDGDMIVPGAFAETLAKDFRDGGGGIPVYWRHRMDDPELNLGITESASEDDHGLRIEGLLDLENAKAAYTYKLLKEGRVGQMSFAFDIEEGAFVEPEDGKAYYELRKLKLHEVSIVPVGANQQTEVMGVKFAAHLLKQEVADGHLSDEEREQVSQARSDLDDVLHEEAAQSDTEPVVNEEDPEGGNSEEPSGAKTARALATMQLVDAIAPTTT